MATNAFIAKQRTKGYGKKMIWLFFGILFWFVSLVPICAWVFEGGDFQWFAVLIFVGVPTWLGILRRSVSNESNEANTRQEEKIND